MKKTLAMLCVIALIAITTVPALANPSIVNDAPKIEEVVTIGGEANLTLTTEEADPSTYTKAVADVVTVVNNPDSEVSLTPADVANSNGLTIKKVPEGFDTGSLASCSFVTTFSALEVQNGTQETYAGKEVNVEVTLDANAMAGVTEDTVSNYFVMQIDPTNGDIYIIPIKIVDGAFVVTLAIVGPYAIIQKL
ncbi:MAG: hypothetical protein IJP78_04725 [Clostridia bacterium]|nr:hypothetical protein [Clostridia bacterium]